MVKIQLDNALNLVYNAYIGPQKLKDVRRLLMRGRPKLIEDSYRIHLNIERSMKDQLTQFAIYNNIAISEVVRKAVAEYLKENS